MSQPAQSDKAAPPQPAGRGAGAAKPFAGLIDAVLVGEPAPFAFSGSVSREAALTVWTWVQRDLCADLVAADRWRDGALGVADLEPLIPDIVARMQAGMDAADANAEAIRRLRVQMGRDDARDVVAVVMAALRHRALLGKAQAFGRAINAIAEDSALGPALQSMPLADPELAALLFHAALGQVANPSRLVSGVVKLAGNASEAAVQRQGFGPLIDAHLAHAQDQLQYLQLAGPFADTDRVCRSLDRFHRLVRALTGYIEFPRKSRSTQVLSAITKQVSDRVEPRLRDVVTDINQAMRRPRDGADRLDNDRLLAAINGVYLLATVRECRDSLALNASFDQAWNQSGQALEVHIQRNLDLLRQHPDDPTTGIRLDAAIKMAEVRFNPEYAETLRRARQAATRRT